tara:strand:- start:300 stop:488 length:189 start_codon:yes stop_codon:yes gene_type:complete
MSYTRLNKLQQQSLFNKWSIDNQDKSYLAFRRTVQPFIGDDSIVVWWSGMLIGIEVDGYTHT